MCDRGTIRIAPEKGIVVSVKKYLSRPLQMKTATIVGIEWGAKLVTVIVLI